MKYLDLVLEDVGEDQWMYLLYYMDHKYPFVTNHPIKLMSVGERHRFIGNMLAVIFNEEINDKVEERPLELLDKLGFVEDDGEDDEDEEEEDDDDES